MRGPFLLALFTLVIINIAAGLFLRPLIEYTDGLSLFNPVYTFAVYGKMAYPAYGYFNNMPVHPPLHYAVLGILYKSGLNYDFMVKLPVFAGYILCVVFACVSRLKTMEKAAVLLTLFYVACLFNPDVNIRPDYSLTVLWFAGLLALENARSRVWSTPWLIVGSLLIAIASTLHYFASFAFTGLMFYVLPVYQTFSGKQRLAKLAALLLPAFIVISFYLCLQVIPNIKDIGDCIAGVHSPKGMSSIAIHFAQYNTVFKDSFLLPVLLFIPAALLAPVILILTKQFKYLALASTPLTLFVLLFSKGKSAGYYTAEVMVLALSLFYLTVYTVSRLLRAKPVITKIVFGFMAFGCLVTLSNAFTNTLKFVKADLGALKLTHDNRMLIARAQMQDELNGKTNLGGRMDLWFVSGATKWFCVSSDILWHDYKETSLHQYFQHFDYIVDHAHMSNNSQNTANETLSSWYVDDTLKLAGFFLADYQPRGMCFTVFPMLIYSCDKQQTLLGSSLVGESELKKYTLDSVSYDYWFYSGVFAAKGFDEVRENLEPYFYLWNKFDLPDKTGKKYQMDEDVKEVLLWGLIPREKASRALEILNKKGVVKDLKPVKSSIVNKEQLMTEYHQKGEQVRFYKTLNDFVNNNAAY
ncbi:MAG: hypothetical protein U0V74_09845 [Chitinophagales bacterium]